MLKMTCAADTAAALAKRLEAGSSMWTVDINEATHFPISSRSDRKTGLHNKVVAFNKDGKE
jgi:hypothetical protein